MTTKSKVYLLRKKIKFFLAPVLLISLIFIFYQLLIFIQLNNEITPPNELYYVRGTNKHQIAFYQPDENGQFVCVRSMEKINFTSINDDYCDCLDGSDEPGTNACSNGEFYCTKQTYDKEFLKSFPSNRVNDGICDCCDGSDEWQYRPAPIHLSDIQQKILHRFLSPCPSLC